jgi:hypothetical protein
MGWLSSANLKGEEQVDCSIAMLGLRAALVKRRLELLRSARSMVVGHSSMIRSPSLKLGLNADSVIHSGLNSLLAAQ